jgi:hypothetical protein
LSLCEDGDRCLIDCHRLRFLVSFYFINYGHVVEGEGEMKLFRRNQSMDELNVEKPIVLYYAEYIGVLSSNKSYPVEEGAYVNVYEDRIVVELLKSKFKTTIPYKNMTDTQNVDAGKKVDMDRVFGLSLVTLGIGSIVGLLWKRHAILTTLKYPDDDSKPQTITLDSM